MTSFKMAVICLRDVRGVMTSRWIFSLLSSIQLPSFTACSGVSHTNMGDTDIRCCVALVRAPPESVSAFAPRQIDATRAPSVVATGALMKPCAW